VLPLLVVVVGVTLTYSLVSAVHKAVMQGHYRTVYLCVTYEGAAGDVIDYIADACASGRPVQLQYTMYSVRVGQYLLT